MSGINLQSLIAMGTQAVQMFGKNCGGIVGVASKAAQVWQEYKKYPQTPEGLRQAMQAHNLDAATIRNALSSLNPKVRQFIDSKFPGSLQLLAGLASSSADSLPSSPDNPSPHSPEVQKLLQRARRR